MPGKKKNAKPAPQSDSESSPEEQLDEEGIRSQLSRLINPKYAEEFVAKLDPAVRTRVHALQGLQKQINELRSAYEAEHKALEKKYEVQYEPIFAKRIAIISGEVEPTNDAVKEGIPEDYKPSKAANKQAAGVKGIPNFWGTVLSHHPAIEDMIQERDVECLAHLTNIVAKNFEDPDMGFTLEFHFSNNEFFTNQTLVKTYHLLTEEEVVLDKATGCEINWKPGKNLTVVMKKKKQKSKGGKGTRVVSKEEPCDSFFNFFKPPQLPTHEEDEEDEDDMEDALEELVEADFEIGQLIKTTIIPKAVKWFTGEAAEDLDMEDSEDEEGEEDSEEDSDEPPPKPAKGPKPKAKAAQQQDCKQQ